jgi:N-acetylglucosaminyl-diphospho-decaprenol L-rhamnosyltransferase
VHDLAIIVVSTNEAHWIRPCLRTVLPRLEGMEADVVVVDNSSRDGVRQMVEEEFRGARVVTSENHGFSHANNRALMTYDARYVLFLNPDTEVVDGHFAELLAAMDERPSVGLAGVRQLLPDGTLYPTIRRFPSAIRAFAEALGSERLPLRAGWLGERELDLGVYEREVSCDWTSGSFLLARREALEAGGFFDERFFMSSEEIDLCYRIRQAGWEIRHLPGMSIVHHAGKRGVNPRMEAQYAWARKQYARKHFSRLERAGFLGALYARHAIRSIAVPGGDAGDASGRREASRLCLRTLAGRVPPPFGDPPPNAVRARSGETVSANGTHEQGRLNGATRHKA